MPAKRMALMKGGIVHEIVIGGPQFAVPKGFDVVETDHANIGDAYDGKAFAVQAQQLDPEQLMEYARRRREVVVMNFMTFNLAKPGNDPKIVKIHITRVYNDIIDLAHLAELTGDDVTFVLPDETITLTSAQAIDLRNRVAKLVGHSHMLLAKILDAIKSGHIASIAHVDFPEQATAVKLPSWFVVHG